MLLHKLCHTFAEVLLAVRIKGDTNVGEPMHQVQGCRKQAGAP